MSVSTGASVINGYREWAIQQHESAEAAKDPHYDQPRDMINYLLDIPDAPLSIPVIIMKSQADSLWNKGEYQAANLLYAKAANDLYQLFGNSIEGHEFVTVDGKTMSVGTLVEESLTDGLNGVRDFVGNLDLRSSDDLTALLSLLHGSLTPDELAKINEIEEKYATATDGGLAQSQMTAEINDVLIGVMERINGEAADLGLDPVFSDGFILDFTEVSSSEAGSAVGDVFVAVNNLFEAIASGDEKVIAEAYVDLQNAKTLLEEFHKKRADSEKAA